MSQDIKASNDWFGFANMQIALANFFYHGSNHHQQAIEIMTNYSFQKPIIHIYDKAMKQEEEIKCCLS